jgi:hypothetical protein
LPSGRGRADPPAARERGCHAADHRRVRLCIKKQHRVARRGPNPVRCPNGLKAAEVAAANYRNRSVRLPARSVRRVQRSRGNLRPQPMDPVAEDLEARRERDRSHGSDGSNPNHLDPERHHIPPFAHCRSQKQASVYPVRARSNPSRREQVGRVIAEKHSNKQPPYGDKPEEVDLIANALASAAGRAPASRQRGYRSRSPRW